MEVGANKSRLEINFIRLLEETQQIANGNKKKDWSFEKFMEDRKLLILYGSETGTAQEVAERVSRQGERYFFSTVVSSMDSFSFDKFLTEELAILIAATTGQGDNPGNMKNFFEKMWKLRKNRTLLHQLRFAVIGLGDSSYQKFNFAGKRINNLLTYLGGHCLLKIALADDQHELGPDYVVDSWLEEFWKKVNSLYPLAPGLKPLDSNVLLPPKFKINFIKDCGTVSGTDNVLSSLGEPSVADILQNSRLTSEDHFQDVRLIEFDVSNMECQFKPGDIMYVLPKNLQENVEEFISTLSLNPGDKLCVEANDNNCILPPKYLLPMPCSVKECVENYFDIQAIPSRYFFEVLAHFSKSSLEKEKLLEFASSEGQQEFYNYCNRPKRSILEVLSDFPHTKDNIPFEYLFEVIPPIKPRAYSIASSCLQLTNKIQLLVAVINYKTVLKKPRLGLCTNWLARQEVGSKVLVWIKSGTLPFPLEVKDTCSVIMIAPGTGCSPFRSYIQERIALGCPGNIILIFGCRYKEKDYFFKDEWERLAESGKLELYCAFSRDQPQKIYVQHKLKEAACRLWELIKDERTSIFYAGNAKRIPIDVNDALTYICKEGLETDEAGAKGYMKNSVEKRFFTETWA